MATLGKLIQLVWLIITLFQPHQSGFIYDHEFFFLNTFLWETNWNWVVRASLLQFLLYGRQMKVQTWRKSFIISRPQFPPL